MQAANSRPTGTPPQRTTTGLKSEEKYSFFSPADVEFNDTTRAIVAAVERIKPARVVFDPFSDIRHLVRDTLRYRRQILALRDFFAEQGCTVLLMQEMTRGTSGDIQAEALTHGYLTLHQDSPEYGGQRRRARAQDARHCVPRRLPRLRNPYRWHSRLHAPGRLGAFRRPAGGVGFQRPATCRRPAAWWRRSRLEHADHGRCRSRQEHTGYAICGCIHHQVRKRPGVDGYEFARTLRSDPRLRSCLLVAVTGYGEARDRQRGAEAGFAHYLTKPADPREIERLLIAV